MMKRKKELEKKVRGFVQDPWFKKFALREPRRARKEVDIISFGKVLKKEHRARPSSTFKFRRVLKKLAKEKEK